MNDLLACRSDCVLIFHREVAQALQRSNKGPTEKNNQLWFLRNNEKFVTLFKKALHWVEDKLNHCSTYRFK